MCTGAAQTPELRGEKGFSDSEIGAPGTKTEVGQARGLWVLRPFVSSMIADEDALSDD